MGIQHFLNELQYNEGLAFVEWTVVNGNDREPQVHNACGYDTCDPEHATVDVDLTDFETALVEMARQFGTLGQPATGKFRLDVATGIVTRIADAVLPPVEVIYTELEPENCIAVSLLAQGTHTFLLVKRTFSHDYLGFGAWIAAEVGSCAIVAVPAQHANWQLMRLASGLQTMAREQFPTLDAARAAAATA